MGVFLVNLEACEGSVGGRIQSGYEGCYCTQAVVVAYKYTIKFLYAKTVFDASVKVR